MAYKSELEQIAEEIEDAKGAIVRAHRLAAKSDRNYVGTYLPNVRRSES